MSHWYRRRHAHLLRHVRRRVYRRTTRYGDAEGQRGIDLRDGNCCTRAIVTFARPFAQHRRLAPCCQASVVAILPVPVSPSGARWLVADCQNAPPVGVIVSRPDDGVNANELALSVTVCVSLSLTTCRISSGRHRDFAEPASAADIIRRRFSTLPVAASSLEYSDIDDIPRFSPVEPAAPACSAALISSPAMVVDGKEVPEH